MPLYLSRFSYTPETWARLIGNPEDRRKAAQSYIESVGGRLHGFWYAFGTHDGYNLWEAPDNVSMAAVAAAISGGALASLETTVLLTVDETMDALRKAGRSGTEHRARSRPTLLAHLGRGGLHGGRGARLGVLEHPGEHRAEPRRAGAQANTGASPNFAASVSRRSGCATCGSPVRPTSP